MSAALYAVSIAEIAFAFVVILPSNAVSAALYAVSIAEIASVFALISAFTPVSS